MFLQFIRQYAIHQNYFSSFTIAQFHQDMHPNNWESKYILRAAFILHVSFTSKNKSYPALVVLYSTLRIGLQGSGFFPSFSCFPKANNFLILNLTVP